MKRHTASLTYKDILKESPTGAKYVRLMNEALLEDPEDCGYGGFYSSSFSLYKLAREACGGTTHLAAIMRIFYTHGINCILDFDTVATPATMRSWKGVGDVYGNIFIECWKIRLRQIKEYVNRGIIHYEEA